MERILLIINAGRPDTASIDFACRIAYGRSMLSRFFKRSSAEAQIRMVDLPIFITHH